MKIIHIVPGSGGTFYCQNCLRDSALVKTLRAQGHDVMMVPLYLPMFTDAKDIAEDVPVFFGGINVYLQQQFKLFQYSPRWLDKFFDLPFMLKHAAAKEGSTSAAELGAMTYSMLQGKDGKQKKELDRLLDWLETHEQPDIIHLSNVLLLGLAPEIKRRLKVPVVFSLQDEDTWLDAMQPPWAENCWGLMGELAEEVDAFIAVSHWYGEKMTQRLELEYGRCTVIPLGIEVDENRPEIVEHNPPCIGFLSRMSKAQGLDLLVDAFLQLKEKPAWRNLKLQATGGMTPADEAFIATQREKIKQAGWEKDAAFLPDFQREDRQAFLQECTVLSVPVVDGEAFGTFILEALAYGVPVAQPAVGAFPEVIEATEGGLIYDPMETDGLLNALEELLQDKEQAKRLGIQGQAKVRAHFTMDRMASEVAALYERLMEGAL